MWQKPIARNSWPYSMHSVYYYWDIRAPAQGCHTLGLIGNYLVDTGRVQWVRREVWYKHLEVPMRGFLNNVFCWCFPCLNCWVGGVYVFDLTQCKASGELRRSWGDLLPLNGQHCKQTGWEAVSFLTCKAASVIRKNEKVLRPWKVTFCSNNMAVL